MAAVPFCFVVTFATFELESDHFLVAKLFNNLGGHRSTINEGSAYLEVRTIAGGQHLFKLYRVADFGIELFNVDLVAGLDTILFATGFKNCVCHRSELL